MGVPGAPRIDRKRHPTTISESARCAITSVTDHLSGIGRFFSFAGVAPFISRANSLAVADCTFIGFFPASLLSIFLMYAAIFSSMKRSLFL